MVDQRVAHERRHVVQLPVGHHRLVKSTDQLLVRIDGHVPLHLSLDPISLDANPSHVSSLAPRSFVILAVARAPESGPKPTARRRHPGAPIRAPPGADRQGPPPKLVDGGQVGLDGGQSGASIALGPLGRALEGGGALGERPAQLADAIREAGAHLALDVVEQRREASVGLEPDLLDEAADERARLLATIGQLPAPLVEDLLPAEHGRHAQDGRPDDGRAEQGAEHPQHLDADGRAADDAEAGHEVRPGTALEGRSALPQARDVERDGVTRARRGRPPRRGAGRRCGPGCRPHPRSPGGTRPGPPPPCPPGRAG